MTIEEPESLEDLCDYILKYSGDIYVRANVGNGWKTYSLKELPPEKAIEFALAFVKEHRIPARLLTEKLKEAESIKIDENVISETIVKCVTISKCNVCGKENKIYDNENKLCKCANCGLYYFSNKISKENDVPHVEQCYCEEFKDAFKEEYLEQPFNNDNNFYIKNAKLEGAMGDYQWEHYYKKITHCPFCGKELINNKKVKKN